MAYMSSLAEQSNDLAQAGMPPAQAEAIAKAIHDAVATAPPRLEVLEERVKHTATSDELSTTTAQMNKLHGEAMTRMNELHGEAMTRMNELHAATSAELSATNVQMNKLHGEAMTRMNELHLTAMERIGNVESSLGDRMAKIEGRLDKIEGDLAAIKWIGGVLTAAVITGLVRLIFFP